MGSWSRSGEFDPRLPAAGEFADGAGELVALDFKLTGHLATLPVGLAGVAEEKIERGLAREEGVVLAEVAEPQPGMADHVAGVEIFVAEDDPQERAFPRAVAADKAGFPIIRDRGGGVVEKHLVAIPLRRIPDFEENRHAQDYTGRSARRSGGHGSRTRNRFPGTTFPVWPLAIRLPSKTPFLRLCVLFVYPL